MHFHRARALLGPGVGNGFPADLHVHVVEAVFQIAGRHRVTIIGRLRGGVSIDKGFATPLGVLASDQVLQYAPGDGHARLGLTGQGRAGQAERSQADP